MTGVILGLLLAADGIFCGKSVIFSMPVVNGDTDGKLPLGMTEGREIMGPLFETALCDISWENGVAWMGANVDGREEVKLGLMPTVGNKEENSG